MLQYLSVLGRIRTNEQVFGLYKDISLASQKHSMNINSNFFFCIEYNKNNEFLIFHFPLVIKLKNNPCQTKFTAYIFFPQNYKILNNFIIYIFFFFLLQTASLSLVIIRRDIKPSLLSFIVLTGESFPFLSLSLFFPRTQHRTCTPFCAPTQDLSGG